MLNLTYTGEQKDRCRDANIFAHQYNKATRPRRRNHHHRGYKIGWLRGRDLNPRPLGYEPNELPDCSTPRYTTYNLALFPPVPEVHTTTANRLRQYFCRLFFRTLGDGGVRGTVLLTPFGVNRTVPLTPLLSRNYVAVYRLASADDGDFSAGCNGADPIG